MPPLDGHALVRCLPRADKFGAEKEKTGGDDKWKIVVNGRTIAWTQVSRGDKKTKTISAPLASAMARQLKITMPLLVDIIGCSKGWREYILALHAQGSISQDIARAALKIGPNDSIPISK